MQHGQPSSDGVPFSNEQLQSHVSLSITNTQHASTHKCLTEFQLITKKIIVNLLF